MVEFRALAHELKFVPCAWLEWQLHRHGGVVTVDELSAVSIFNRECVALLDGEADADRRVRVPVVSAWRRGARSLTVQTPAHCTARGQHQKYMICSPLCHLDPKAKRRLLRPLLGPCAAIQAAVVPKIGVVWAHIKTRASIGCVGACGRSLGV
eukprot:2781817-Prymnesium_polylepis.2